LKDANNIYFIFVAKWHMDGVIDDEGIDVHLEDDDEPYLDALGASQCTDTANPDLGSDELHHIDPASRVSTTSSYTCTWCTHLF
jgi:hypothetical protein